MTQLTKENLIELFKEYVQEYMFTKIDFDLLYEIYTDGYIVDYFLNHYNNKRFIEQINLTKNHIIEFEYKDWL